MNISKFFNLWAPPISLTLWLWLTVGYVRVISDALRTRGLLARSLWALTFVFATGVVYQWLRQSRGRFSWGGLVALLVCFGLYGWSMVTLVVDPVERIHFLQIGLVTFLYHRAFRNLWPESRWVSGLAFLAGALVGTIEEFLQKLCPNRVFDWRDVRMNIYSTILAVIMIRFVLGADTSAPSKLV